MVAALSTEFAQSHVSKDIYSPPHEDVIERGEGLWIEIQTQVDDARLSVWYSCYEPGYVTFEFWFGGSVLRVGVIQVTVTQNSAERGRKLSQYCTRSGKYPRNSCSIPSHLSAKTSTPSRIKSRIFTSSNVCSLSCCTARSTRSILQT